MQAKLFAILLLPTLASCAMDTAMQTAQAEAAKAGCLCAGAGCAVSVSASGQAAVGAEAAGALRTIQLNAPSQGASPKAR